MHVIDTVAGWRKALDAERASGRRVGLVPTMGALHAGHAALVARASGESDVVGVTVFVNPLQFGANEDLASYPRTLDADVALAEAHGASYVFAPSVKEMYPQPITTTVSAGPLATRWEGESRPGHFDGVCTVVTKLLSQAGACRAYFGEKDYQQLCIVRRLVADLDLPAEIVGCPTVREPDGLALSSRNAYLTPAERAVAPSIFASLQKGAEIFARSGDPRAAEQVPFPHVDLIYAAIVDTDTLEPLAPGQPSGRFLVAARLGTTRLIDNLGVTCAVA